MTREELYGYLRSPSTLGVHTLPELRALVELYPYCPTFIYLYLYNLAHIEDLRYSQELHWLSVFLPDRERLYREVEQVALVVQGAEPTSAEQEDAFALIDSFLSGAKAGGQDLPQELSWGVGGMDRDDYFSSVRVRGTASPLETVLLRPDEATARRGGAVVSSKAAESGATGAEDLPSRELEDDVDLDEALFTETLAAIYIKQGRYDKALRMIHAISLNYPKKNRFFAQQIRFLERLILNK